MLPFWNCGRHDRDFGAIFLSFKAADRYRGETLGTSGA